MTRLALALTLAALPALASAGQDMWTWTDDAGTVHYSNIAKFTPDGAKAVDSRITVEVDRIPGDESGAADSVTDMESYRRLPFDGGNQFTGRYERGRVYDSFRDHHAESTYPNPGGFQALPDAPRVYDEARLKFGCYTAGVLWAGGFSHAGDISGVPNCYPYRLGPRAWLNAAQAELAMRENGISPRDMMQLYMEERGAR